MKINIITGSTLGSAEYLAEHLADLLAQDYDCAIFHGANFDDIKDEHYWLIVTSTHGAGEFPDNISPFFTEIEQTDKDLTQVKFAVVGLGNSDYDTFCFAAKRAESILKNKQATQLCESLYIDMPKVEDPDAYAEAWLPQLLHTLNTQN